MGCLETGPYIAHVMHPSADLLTYKMRARQPVQVGRSLSETNRRETATLGARARRARAARAQHSTGRAGGFG